MSIHRMVGPRSRPVVERDTTAILVLGAAVWRDGPSPTLRRRAEAAARAWHEGRAARLVASGGTGTFPPSEARTIADLLIAAGVPAERIDLEEQSRTTLENLAFSLPLLSRHGIRRLILVTDHTHAPRARMTARAFGFEAESRSPPLRGARWRTLAHQGLREAIAFPFYAGKLAPIKRALRRAETAPDR